MGGRASGAPVGRLGKSWSLERLRIGIEMRNERQGLEMKVSE